MSADELFANAESAFANAVAQIDRTGKLEKAFLDIAPRMVGREVDEIAVVLNSRLTEDGMTVPPTTVIALAQLIHDPKPGQGAA